MTVTVSAYAGRTDFESADFLDHARVFYVTPADLVANVFRYSLPVGVIVKAVQATILTAFDGTNLTVGDSVTANGFLAIADLSITTLNATVNSLTKVNTFQQGKYYPLAPALIVVTFTGVNTVGKLRVDLVLAGKDEGLAPKPKDLINNW